MEAIATVAARLTSSDAADVRGWLDRAQRDLEAQGALVDVDGLQLDVAVQVLRTWSTVRVTVGADLVEVELTAPLSADRALSSLLWFCDLLELTPVEPAVANGTTIASSRRPPRSEEPEGDEPWALPTFSTTDDLFGNSLTAEL